MRKSTLDKFLLLAFVCLGTTMPVAGARSDEPRVVEAGTTPALYAALESVGPADTSGVLIRLVPGIYVLSPTAMPEVGLYLSGRLIQIEGTSAENTSLVVPWNAGIVFDNCTNCALRRVSIVSDNFDYPNVLVTADNSSAEVRNCVIRGPVGTTSIYGTGRDTRLTLAGNEIHNMTGTGIILDDVLEAAIERNVIVGPYESAMGEIGTGDRARNIVRAWQLERLDDSGNPHGSSAAGILLSRRSRARIEKNLIRYYEVGVDILDSSEAELLVNFIEEMRASGIRFSGHTAPVLNENVVFRTGACGVRIDVKKNSTAHAGASSGRMWRNYIVHTGSDAEFDDGRHGTQCPLSLEQVPEGFEFDANTYYDNRRVGECEGVPKDRTREWFWRKRRSYLRKYRNTKIGVDGRHSFWDSSFLERYSRF